LALGLFTFDACYFGVNDLHQCNTVPYRCLTFLNSLLSLKQSDLTIRFFLFKWLLRGPNQNQVVGIARNSKNWSPCGKPPTENDNKKFTVGCLGCRLQSGERYWIFSLYLSYEILMIVSLSTLL